MIPKYDLNLSLGAFMKNVILALLALTSVSTYAASGNVSVVVGKGLANVEIYGPAAQNIKTAMTLASASKGMPSRRRSPAPKDFVLGQQITCSVNFEGKIYTVCRLTFDSAGTASVTNIAINNKSADGTVVAGGMGDYSNVTISGESAKAISKLLKNTSGEGRDIRCSATSCQFSVDASGSINRNFAR